jgi:L-ascorbate metabolism protein UlaG (beta-lactamase superfamily)
MSPQQHVTIKLEVNNMNITFYGYNTFVIESGDKKIAIDPGALFLYYFRLTTLIPKPEWNEMTHIFVTHGDPDHYWHTDRVAEASNAPVICNKTMVRNINGNALMLGPRDKGIAFTTPMKRVHPISVDETIQLDGMSITGLKATHGPLTLKLGPFSKTVHPGPEERLGWGAIGFKIQLDGKTIVNLGDTLLHTNEWASIKHPDVLMIPIGGKIAHNTMDEEEALQAVRMMKPTLVIPCHYNCPAFFTKKYCAADDTMFKHAVEQTEAKCVILHENESVEI